MGEFTCDCIVLNCVLIYFMVHVYVLKLIYNYCQSEYIFAAQYIYDNNNIIKRLLAIIQLLLPEICISKYIVLNL